MTSFPVLTFEAAFTSDPLDDTPVYTDLSARLDPGNTTRMLGQAGLATLVLDNLDGALDAWNTASPHFGNLLTAQQASLEDAGLGTTGWVALSGTTIARSTALFNDGVASLEMQCPSGGSAIARTTEGTAGVAVVPLKPYYAMAWFAAPVTARNCELSIVWYDSGGSLISVDTGAQITDSGWTQATVAATAPSNAAFAAVQVHAKLTAAGELHNVDKICFSGGDPTVYGYVWTPGGRGGNIQPMVKARLSAQWNLLSANDASIETDASGWGALGVNTIARSTAQHLVGAASLELTGTGAGNSAARTGTLHRVRGENTYTAVASFIQGTTARTCRVYLEWYDSGSIYLGNSTAGSIVESSGWQFVGVTVTAPTTAVYARLVVEVVATVNTEKHYVDAAGIFPGASSTWSPGGPYYLFTGYVEDWAAEWEDIRYGDTAVRLVDANKITTLGKQARSDFHDAQLADSPAGLYQLNETTQSTADAGLIRIVDSSGNGADGHYKGSPANYEVSGALPAEVGTAVDFGIRQGWAELPNAVCPHGTVDFTFEAWVFPRSINQTISIGTPTDRIFHGEGVGSQTLGLTILTDGTLNFNAFDGTDGGYLPTTAPLQLGRWNHVMACKVGTTGPSNWAILIDKVDVSDHGAEVLYGTGNCSITANPILLAGYEVSGVGQGALDGLVDEAAIYFSDLTSRADDHFDAAFGLATEALSGTRAGQLLDMLDFPAADRVLDSGQFYVQPVADRLYDTPLFGEFEVLVESEGWPALWFFDAQGRAVFQDSGHGTPATSATFSDASAGLYFDPGPGPSRRDDSLWTRVALERNNGTTQILEDPAAAKRYVGRTLTRRGLKNTSDADVATVTSAELARWKTPKDRIDRLTIHPIDEPATMWPQVLGRELGDRITVTRTDLPGGGAPFTGDFRIAGIGHAFTGQDWVTTWQLEPT